MNCLIVARWVVYSNTSLILIVKASPMYLACRKTQAIIDTKRHARFHRGAEEETYTLDDVVAQTIEIYKR